MPPHCVVCRTPPRRHATTTTTTIVYGLACNALSPKAAKHLYETKARPLSDPLIVHVLSAEDAIPLTNATSKMLGIFHALVESFWPGPLTVILPSSEMIPPIITSNSSTVALRSPQHPTCRKVMSKVALPLAMPSANMFGHVSPTKKEHVLKDFPRGVMIVEDGDVGGSLGKREVD